MDQKEAKDNSKHERDEERAEDKPARRMVRILVPTFNATTLSMI
jgi:hypothetical protein